jgi:hypothetical protein
MESSCAETLPAPAAFVAPDSDFKRSTTPFSGMNDMSTVVDTRS